MKEDRCVCCGEIIPEGRMICAECEKLAAKPCDCFNVHNIIDVHCPKAKHEKTVCYGTKECDPCSCGGDPSKCDHYPEKRAKAEKARAALTLEQLRADAEEFGYNLVQKPKKITLLPCPLCGRTRGAADWYDAKRHDWYRACKCGFQGKHAIGKNKIKMAWNEAVEEYSFVKERLQENKEYEKC